jgi:outer membrane lipoprotein-sorting protein
MVYLKNCYGELKVKWIMSIGVSKSQYRKTGAVNQEFSRMLSRVLTLFMVLSFSSFTTANTSLTQAQVDELLVALDGYRGYRDQGFTFSITNISYKKDKDPKKNELSVKVLGEQSLVRFDAPARDKGRAMLKEGKNMWLSIPGTRRVIRIAPSQRLIGETSNSDVVGTNFSENYQATLQDEERIEGVNYWVLKLSSKDSGLAYDHIKVWLAKTKETRPLKSEFYTRSNKLLKTAYYKSFKQFGDQVKVHKLLLVDGLMKDNYTWMKFDDYRLRALNETEFQKSALTNLQF